GAVFGTPAFMAPEQGRDAKNVDERADVYSFAATMYAALTGRPPFVAESVTEVIVQVQLHAPPSLRLLAPHVPPALESVITQCLAKDPQARPSSIEEAWGAVRAALGVPVAQGRPAS